MTAPQRSLRGVLTVAALAIVLNATSGPAAQDRPDLTTRTGVPARPSGLEGTALPPDVRLDDGLTQDEAVAIALWNSPEFAAQVASLGFARADLVEAGLLRNPVLSLLFPVGPKQLEATLKFPIEVLWERPRRIAAAKTAFDAAAASLEQQGLTLVADVKIAFIDLALALDRAALAGQAAKELAQIDALTQSRLRAGDISELEARTAAIDAARARQDQLRAELDVPIRLNDLRGRLGLALDQRDVRLSLTAQPAACGPATALLDEALASRPDVRAAELRVEAAAKRLGWERSRILALAAVLDANGSGSQGFEAGPGIEGSIPLFDRNQGGRTRAAADLEVASRQYVVARHRVATELRDAVAQSERASASVAGWRETVMRPLEEQVAAAERSYTDGEVSYLFVLEMARRLTEGRIATREAEADLARAVARIERALGRRCLAGEGERARAF
jgi:cobalt-zinc-cadmium efflux system outer membrane protein